jgi:serine/threonine protein kinase
MVAYRLDCKVGDILNDKYRIVKAIGSGSFGDVFKVEDTSGNDYALKILRLWEVASDLHATLLSKFEQEYKTARIASEYLVHSTDFGVVGGNPYLVMEFCPNGDLSKGVTANRKMLPTYAHDILEGLHALHVEGKIHRDLKPENVLIRNNGKAALTDFGVVGEMDQKKRLSEVRGWKKRPVQTQGTPLYMSPEIADREGGGITYLPTVDLWSFGVMMYELLTEGSFPFGNISTHEELPHYLERARKGQWDAEQLKRTEQGAQWYHVIDRCLEPDYRKRYQSAYEVMQDLRPIIGEMRPSVRQEQRSPHISRLVITQGAEVGKVYDLGHSLPPQGRMLRVGRILGNDIVLSESDVRYISRYHFTMERAQDGSYWTIRDGQWHKDERRWVLSTNGTYLNATPVSANGIRVFTGDIITVGEYKIKVE